MTPARTLLLVQPQSLLRRTVASVAREMRLAEVREATSIASAMVVLQRHRVDALFVDLDEGDAALDLLVQVRAGRWGVAPGLPVAATASACDASLALRLRELRVRRLLLTPFKVKGVLEAVEGLWRDGAVAEPAADRSAPAVA